MESYKNYWQFVLSILQVCVSRLTCLSILSPDLMSPKHRAQSVTPALSSPLSHREGRVPGTLCPAPACPSLPVCMGTGTQWEHQSLELVPLSASPALRSGVWGSWLCSWRVTEWALWVLLSRGYWSLHPGRAGPRGWGPRELLAD